MRHRQLFPLLVLRLLRIRMGGEIFITVRGASRINNYQPLAPRMDSEKYKKTTLISFYNKSKDAFDAQHSEALGWDICTSQSDFRFGGSWLFHKLSGSDLDVCKVRYKVVNLLAKHLAPSTQKFRPSVVCKTPTNRAGTFLIPRLDVILVDVFYPRAHLLKKPWSNSAVVLLPMFFCLEQLFAIRQIKLSEGGSDLKGHTT